jgi:alpha-tubulin suppressor-like RCC1 family protein
LALQSDGTVVGWGYNGWGEASAPEFTSKPVAIGASIQSSMAVLSDGSVVAWGYPGSGSQLTVPDGLANVVDISIGNSHAVALHANGTVTTWGSNSEGQQNIPAGLANVVEVHTRGDHTIVRTASGSVVVWGNNTSNQATVPTSLTNVRGVAAGYNHTVVFHVDVSTTSTPTRTATSTPTRTATSTPTRTRTRTATATSIPSRPGAFAKLGPLKNATNRPVNTTLSWDASRFASSYEYCLSTTNTCPTWKSVGTARSVTVTNLQRNRIYYWHVRARNSLGVTNSTDSMWRFATVR